MRAARGACVESCITRSRLADEPVDSPPSSSSSHPLLKVYPALSVPAYRLTWAGMLPSQMAINMGEVATPYAAFVLTGEATAIGLVNLAAGIPMMAFTLVGGVVADRLPRRAILLSAQGLALVGTSLLAWVVLSGRLEVWHLAAFAALQGTVFAFNNPSYQAFVAELVPRRMLRSAIALNMTGFNLSRVVGPSVAGLLLSVPMLGLAAVYGVMAALNAVALASLGALRRQHAIARPAVNREAVVRVSGWAQLTEGLRYVVSVPILRTLLLMGLIPVLFAFPVQAMLPIFSERVYESGPVGLGILSASVGVGALSGSVVGAGLSQHSNPIRLQLLIGAMLGAVLIAFALAPALWIAVPLAAMIGFAQLVYMVLNNGMIIASADARLHGRVTSVNMLRFSITPLAILGATWLSDTMGPRATVALGGTVMLLAMLALVRVTSK
jgi:MFS family permease